jgi:hypothetical protein
MKNVMQWIIILCLGSIYGAVAAAILRPNISQEYREYYITKNSTDFNPEHYPGTPEQGMFFGREGLPTWVRSSHGLNIRSDEGRFTDANLGTPAGLTFAQRLNGDVCLDLIASSVRWLTGKTMQIRLGDQAQTVRINEGRSEYRLDFKVHDADRLDLVLPPKLPRVIEQPPYNADPRRLGVLLYRLRLLPGECSSAANNRPWPEPPN